MTMGRATRSTRVKEEPVEEAVDVKMEDAAVEAEVEDQKDQGPSTSSAKKGRGRTGVAILESDEEEEGGGKAKPKMEGKARAKRATKEMKALQENKRREEKFREELVARELKETEASALQSSMDHTQYFPVQLLHENPAEEAQRLADQGYRVDMNGRTEVSKQAMIGEDQADEEVDVDSGDGFKLYQFPTRLPEMPKSGKVGKLRKYKDGTQELDIGGVIFDVSPGTLSACCHDVAILSTQEEKCVFVGSVSDKRVCTPSLRACEW